MKITRIRIYKPQRLNRTFNQSNYVVTVETDTGVVGIGEGGTPDTLTQCAQMLIGEDPRRSHHLWQMMYRGWFYPAGREKLHALGALDLALWDIKGKVLNTPVYDLLGGLTRDYMECYATGFRHPGTLAEKAKACIDAGFRAFRIGAGDGPGPFNARQQVNRAYRQSQIVSAAVGDGDWAIDFHTRFDLADAVRLANLLEPLNPLFCEDPLRSENPTVLAAFRQQTKVPVAVGEQFGDRWDVNELIENHLIDYTRVTLPNVGGITEMVKIAALCETHYIGMIPHFTGHISVAALVHVFASQPIPVVMELAGGAYELPAHLRKAANFHDGKLWPVNRPGLGVDFDPEEAELVGEITEKDAPIPMLYRPDGSITNW